MPRPYSINPRDRAVSECKAGSAAKLRACSMFPLQAWWDELNATRGQDRSGMSRVGLAAPEASRWSRPRHPDREMYSSS